MVTKQVLKDDLALHGFILAKNHMVTKRGSVRHYKTISFILAKNHMVTKPEN